MRMFPEHMLNQPETIRAGITAEDTLVGALEKALVQMKKEGVDPDLIARCTGMLAAVRASEEE